MKRTFIIACALTMSLFGGCKKDPQLCDCPTNGNVCTDLPLASLGAFNTGYNFIYDTGYVTYPYFNPNNGNEIIFYKPNTSSGPQLIKFNLATKQQQIIFTQGLIGAPKWGRNGWILFSLGQAYKIKDTGDSLTQLTFNAGNNYNPEWNYAGNEFITEYAGNTYGYIIYNTNGQPRDTLPYIFSSINSWQNPNNLLLGNLQDYSLGILNPQNDSMIQIFTDNSSSVTDGPVFWFPDGVNILYGNSCGVFKLNYMDGSKSCIQSKCSNDQYLYSCISSISQKIICEIDHWKSAGGANILVTSKLVLMNFDGTGQQVIPTN